MIDSKVPMTMSVENKEGVTFVYCTLPQLARDPQLCFTLPMLRYYVLHAHSNGLERALRRIGRKILVRKDLFIDWLESQSRKAR
jgi:hypothetical protein